MDFAPTKDWQQLCVEQNVRVGNAARPNWISNKCIVNEQRNLIRRRIHNIGKRLVALYTTLEQVKEIAKMKQVIIYLLAWFIDNATY